MSINWVMLSETEGFTPLPGEQRLYTSPPRTSLSLQSVNKFPGREPYSIQSSSGCVHLTNRRIVYLPSNPSPSLQSFAAPILNLHDTHVTAPFFGPNVWTAIVQPVPGGGVPPPHVALELKMTFKDGGAFDFHTSYERVKERLQQVIEVQREGGGDRNDDMDVGNVHLDDLPRYEEAGGGAGATAAASAGAGVGVGTAASSVPQQEPLSPASVRSSSLQENFNSPAEPPPGYEEVQRGSVADELERRLRNAS